MCCLSSVYALLCDSFLRIKCVCVCLQMVCEVSVYCCVCVRKCAMSRKKWPQKEKVNRLYASCCQVKLSSAVVLDSTTHTFITPLPDSHLYTLAAQIIQTKKMRLPRRTFTTTQTVLPGQVVAIVLMPWCSVTLVLM